MHDVIIVGIPLIAILAGMFFNRSDGKDLRKDMIGDLKDVRGELRDLRTQMRGYRLTSVLHSSREARKGSIYLDRAISFAHTLLGCTSVCRPVVAQQFQR